MITSETTNQVSESEFPYSVARAFIQKNPGAIKKAVVEKLQVLHSNWLEATENLDGSLGNLGQRMTEKRSTIARLLNLGKPVPDEAFVSQATVERSLEELREISRERQRQIGKEVYAIAEEIYADLLKDIDAWLILKIQDQGVLFTECGVSYDSSKCFLASRMRKAVDSLRQRWQNCCSNRTAGAPVTLFGFLDLKK